MRKKIATVALSLSLVGAISLPCLAGEPSLTLDYPNVHTFFLTALQSLH